MNRKTLRRRNRSLGTIIKANKRRGITDSIVQRAL